MIVDKVNKNIFKNFLNDATCLNNDKFLNDNNFFFQLIKDMGCKTSVMIGCDIVL